jgi:hypothetical protein
VTRLAEQYDAEVLVVAGDVRARQLLVDQLPKIWQERAVQTDSQVDQATQVAIGAVAATRLHDAIDRFAVPPDAAPRRRACWTPWKRLAAQPR